MSSSSLSNGGEKLGRDEEIKEQLDALVAMRNQSTNKDVVVSSGYVTEKESSYMSR